MVSTEYKQSIKWISVASSVTINSSGNLCLIVRVTFPKNTNIKKFKGMIYFAIETLV